MRKKFPLFLDLKAKAEDMKHTPVNNRIPATKKASNSGYIININPIAKNITPSINAENQKF
jgi:hypothetical protein